MEEILNDPRFQLSVDIMTASLRATPEYMITVMRVALENAGYSPAWVSGEDDVLTLGYMNNDKRVYVPVLQVNTDETRKTMDDHDNHVHNKKIVEQIEALYRRTEHSRPAE